jgi:hypothetical protein
VLRAMIRELFDLEDRAKRWTPEDRLALHQGESRAVLDRFRAYLDGDAVARLLPKSAFDEAVGYLRNHWDALGLFLTEGRVTINNTEIAQLM